MKKKLPTMINESGEIPIFNLEEYICRATPCIIVNPLIPSSFSAKILSMNTTYLRNEMDKAIAEIYEPLVQNALSDDPVICEMNEMLNEAYKVFCDVGMKKSELGELLKSYLGNYGIVYFKNQFYRVEILEWNFVEGMTKVYLVDEGFLLDLSMFAIFPLSHKLKKYPYFTIRCHLNDLSPPGSEQSWPESSVTKFQDLLNKREKWLLFIYPLDVNSPTTPVDIFWPQEDTVCNIMLSSSAAAEVDVGNYGDNRDYMNEHSESDINNYEDNEEDPGVAIYGFVGNDDEEICFNFAGTGYCYKGEACRKLHVLTKPNLVTNLPKSYYINAKVQLPVLDINKKYDLINFYVSDKTNVVLKQDFSKYENAFCSMMKTLNLPINVANLMRLSLPPAVGELVLYFYDGSKLKGWVRAQCMESYPHLDHYELLIVDSGSMITANLRELRYLDAQFLNVPFLSRAVTLDGVRIYNAIENSNFIDEIKGCLEWSMEVVDDFFDVPKVKITNENNESLADIIIQMKLGIKKEFDRPTGQMAPN